MRRQFPGMRDVAARRGADLCGFDGAHGGRMTIESDKLDFVSFAVGVDMHDSSDIARLQTVLRQRLGQNHSVVLIDHSLQGYHRG